MASKITVAELLVDIGVDPAKAKKAEDALKKVGKTAAAAERESKKATVAAEKAKKQAIKERTKAAKEAEKVAAKIAKEAEKRRKEFNDGLKKMGKQIAVFGAAVAAAATGVFAFVSSVTASGDEIGKAAKQFGTGVEELQRLRFAADRSGASADTLSMALKNQARFIRDAQLSGVTPFTEALEEVNISLNDLASLKTPEERFGRIGEALRDVEDPAKRTALAMKLVGEESGPRLIPFLLEGRKGLRALGDEAQDLGLILGEDSVAASEAFQDTMTNVKSVLKGITNIIALELLPSVEESIKSFIEWAKANRGLIRERVSDFLTKILKVAKRLLPVFEALGRVVLFLVENFDSLIAIMAGAKLASAFSVASAGLQALGIAAGGALGPLGLILGTLIALTPAALKAAKAITDSRLSKLEKETGFHPTSAEGVEEGQETPAILAAGKQIAADKVQIAKIQNFTGLESSTAIDKLRGRMKANVEKIAALKNRNVAPEVKALAAKATEDALFSSPEVFSSPEAFSSTGVFDPGLGGSDAKFKPKAVEGGKKATATTKDPVSAVTLQDVINRVIGGGDLGDLVRATPSVAEIEPTIAIDITNNNINVQVKQDIRGSTDPKLTADIATKKMEAFFNGVLRQAGQQLAGNRVI